MSAMRLPNFSFAPAGPPAPSPLETYRGRDDVTAAQRALLHLIGRLSTRHGFCYASNQFLADELKLSHRHTKRLLVELREGGWIAVTHRRAKTSLLRVKKWPVENLSIRPLGGEDIHAPPGGTSVSPPGGTSVSPKELKRIKIGGHADGPGQGTLPFDGQRAYFNPRRPWNDHDRWLPLQRLAYGFKQQRFLYTAFDGRVVTLSAVDWTAQHARLTVIDEAGPDRPGRALIVKAEDLDAWVFWR